MGTAISPSQDPAQLVGVVAQLSPGVRDLLEPL
jgi:hypothetical protein